MTHHCPRWEVRPVLQYLTVVISLALLRSVIMGDRRHTVLLGIAHPRGNIDPAGMMNPSAALPSFVILSICILGPYALHQHPMPTVTMMERHRTTYKLGFWPYRLGLLGCCFETALDGRFGFQHVDLGGDVRGRSCGHTGCFDWFSEY